MPFTTSRKRRDSDRLERQRLLADIPQNLGVPPEISRYKHALSTLAGGAASNADAFHTHANLGGTASIETGAYIGDGSTSKIVSLSNSNLQIAYLKIWAKVTGFGVEVISHEATPGIGTWIGGGGSIYQDADENELRSDGIQSINTKGQFTVDDNNGDEHPNKSSQEYHYLAIGPHQA